MEDKWDILLLDEEMDEMGWSHLRVMERLHQKGIDVYFADMWGSQEVAFLVGCNATAGEIARALGMHTDAVYVDADHCFVILNLFQEKYLRLK